MVKLLTSSQNTLELVPVLLLIETASTLASFFPVTPGKLSDSAVDTAMVMQMMAGRVNFVVGNVETRLVDGGQ